ncbi:MAG: SDR family NAD(P)-dependent oxidoreductase [Treponema sp.]|nr:SDR family NAD(P)-dependent oxidoreductase [Treponema sp.]
MIVDYTAALIRGFYIDLTGRPQTVVTEEWPSSAPENALKLEMNPEENGKFFADFMRNKYEDWKKSFACGAGEGRVLLPSCAALTDNGKTKALFWIDNDIDSARKRQAERDDTPRMETPDSPGDVISAEERAYLFKNRIALVTGGAQGIGEEIVRNLTAMGALVFIADLNLEGAQRLTAIVNENEKRTAALALQADVSSEESVQLMFSSVLQLTGGIDLCISNAGVLKAGSVLDQELSDFKFVTDINYTGFFIISKFAGRLLRSMRYSAPRWSTDIIQINSKSGLEGSNKNGAYAGGKFGSLGLVASFAMELVEYGIKVNAVCPGNFLDGPLWSDPEKGLFVQYLKTGKVPGAKTIADVRTFYESRVPMKRGCTGRDLVRAIYYIVEQQYETGQAVPVTGGQIMLH